MKLNLKKKNKDFKPTFSKKIVFNKIGKETKFNYYYFPYASMSKSFETESVSEFEFKKNIEIYKIRKLYPNDYLILLFGEVINTNKFNFFEKNFSNFISKKIAKDKSFLSQKIRFINFSHQSTGILSNIIQFILFSHLLRPQLVLNHFELNDFIAGQKNDAYLIKNYDFIYNPLFEIWSKNIQRNYNYKPKNGKFYKNGLNRCKILKSNNNLHVVLKAVKNRIFQFKNIVESQNSKFLCGFLPSPFKEKKFLNPKKKKLFRNIEKSISNDISYNKIFYSL